ncbi:MAG TPA: hypothetical protein VE860_07655 [Chthoniobacterales bacterium]|nr:hypothetical protein [Chthoniobacterales bacterium]
MSFFDCLEKSDSDVVVAKPALLVIGPTYAMEGRCLQRPESW